MISLLLFWLELSLHCSSLTFKRILVSSFKLSVTITSENYSRRNREQHHICWLKISALLCSDNQPTKKTAAIHLLFAKKVTFSFFATIQKWSSQYQFKIFAICHSLMDFKFLRWLWDQFNKLFFNFWLSYIFVLQIITFISEFSLYGLAALVYFSGPWGNIVLLYTCYQTTIPFPNPTRDHLPLPFPVFFF